MKILALSDLHGNLPEKLPNCDVLCLCGDIVPLNIQINYQKSTHWWTTRFAKWANKLDCKKVIVIPGNHDFLLELLYENDLLYILKNDLHTETNDKVEVLVNELYEYNGITFYGYPKVAKIGYGRWAFEDRDDNKYFIPECDVLLTHDHPAYNSLLRTAATSPERKYKVWFCGHWHEGDNIPALDVYGCSRLDDRYRWKKHYKYVIIDTDAFLKRSDGLSTDELNKTIPEENKAV